MLVDVGFWLTMMFAAGLAACAIYYLSPFYRDLIKANQTRVESLDGFRGLLATSVVVHHLAVTRGFVRTGAWMAVDSHLLQFCGPGAVAFFFMMTGFLFWSRAIDDKLSAKSLLLSRFWRIMPLYWFSTLVIVITVFSITGWQIREDPVKLCLSLSQWACGGLLGAPSINTVNVVVINGVTWTLQYEWVFYLALPFLVGLVKPSRFIILVCVYVVALVASRTIMATSLMAPLGISVSFLCGMIAAYGVRFPRVRRIFGNRSFSWCLIPLLAAGVEAYTWNKTTANVLFLLPVFLSIACGNTAFGLLVRPSALLLGHVSYSIYLLHSLLLWHLTQFKPIENAIGGTWIDFWVVSTGLVAMVVLISSLSYRVIEHPFLRSSRRKIVSAPSAALPVAKLPHTKTLHGPAEINTPAP